jgi:hypothetical protein
MGTGGPFPGVKRQGREADHSLPTSAEVKNPWIYTYTPSCFPGALLNLVNGMYNFAFTMVTPTETKKTAGCSQF